MRKKSTANLARATEIFDGIAFEDVEPMLCRLNAAKKVYSKGDAVELAGFEAKKLHVIVSGRLHVYEKTFGGHQVLVREICRGEVLGMWLLFVTEITCWPGTVVAAEQTTVIALDMAATRRMLWEAATPQVARFAVNVSKSLVRAFYTTWRKLAVMSTPTIETKVQIYLSTLRNEAGRAGVVKVPFNRKLMAEYFGVTRPALSKALGRMRDRGLLSWRRKEFTINF